MKKFILLLMLTLFILGCGSPQPCDVCGMGSSCEEVYSLETGKLIEVHCIEKGEW